MGGNLLRAAVGAIGVGALSVVLATPASADDESPPPTGSSIFDLVASAALESPAQVREDGAVLVEVTAADADSVADMIGAAESLIEVTSVAESAGVVVGWAPPGAREALEALPSVRSVRTPPAPNVGAVAASSISAADWIPAPSCRSVPVDADAPLATAIARETFGVDGAGVVVGVISDSFAASLEASTTWEQDVQLGALPGPSNPCGYTTPVTIVADEEPGEGWSDEGRAMAQLVHGIAPGARILFAAGGPSAYVMAERIDALVAAGADVIVDDISYYLMPGYQEGPIGDSIRAATAAGVAYFSSAGNGSIAAADTGRQIASWTTDTFLATTCPALLDDDRNAGCLNFGTAAEPDPTLRVTLSRERGPISFSGYVYWDEPWYGVQAPMALIALTAETSQPVGAALCVVATNPDEYACDESTISFAIDEESVELPPGAEVEVDLVVIRYPNPGEDASSVPDPGLRIMFPSGGGVLVGMEHDLGGTADGRTVTVGPTLAVNNAGPNLFAVGAAPAHAPGALEPFSSFGPASLTWAPLSSAGPGMPAAPLPTPWVRPGPDAVAVDGVRTTFFGGANTFYGTSAAAPNTAAVAALLLQAVPGLAPGDLYSTLRDSADDTITGIPGVADEHTVGSGLIRATAALSELGASTDHPFRAPVPPLSVPADTASLLAIASADGVPQVEAVVTEGLAVVQGIPGVGAGDWIWTYGYSTPVDLGWSATGAGGAAVVRLHGLPDGEHRLAFMRGDELLATAHIAIGPSPAILPVTGPAAVGLLGGAALAALAVGGALLAARRFASRH